MNMFWLTNPDLKNDDWFAYWDNWVSFSDSNWKQHTTYNIALLFSSFDRMARRRLTGNADGEGHIVSEREEGRAV